MLRSRFALLLTTAALLTPALDASTATVFAVKRGKVTARNGDNVVVRLLPGIDIPANALVEVPEGAIGVKLPDGTSAYFPGGTSFRLVLPDTRGETPEIILLSGSVTLSTVDSNFIVRTAAGTVDVGDCAATVAYAPKAPGADAVLLVRLASGAMKINPTGAAVLALNKPSEALLRAGSAPVVTPLDESLIRAVKEGATGRVPLLRRAALIPVAAEPPAAAAPSGK